MMGIFKRFRSKAAVSPGAGASGERLAATLLEQTPLSPQRCDRCGSSYISSEALVFVVSSGPPDLGLDVGGYCPRCRKHQCSSHLRYGNVLNLRLPDPERFRSITWGLLCAACGTQVWHGPVEPERAVTVLRLDLEDLEPKRPAVNPEYAAPSGKWSLHKIYRENTFALPHLTCDLCGDSYPHPLEPPAFGLRQWRASGWAVRPGDFEVDLGGGCERCGNICGKHAVLKEMKFNGEAYLALFCARHDVRLGGPSSTLSS